MMAGDTDIAAPRRPVAAMTEHDRAHLIDLHLQALAVLGWQPPSDAIEQAARGDLLFSPEAAIVSGRDTSTAARWAQMAEDEGRPIAVKAGGTWLFVTKRLLCFIERKFKLSARREAETRLKKLLQMRARSHRSTPNASPRASSAAKPCDNIDGKPALDPDPEPRAVGME
jgi:hypothetical protein